MYLKRMESEKGGDRERERENISEWKKDVIKKEWKESTMECKYKGRDKQWDKI